MNPLRQARTSAGPPDGPAGGGPHLSRRALLTGAAAVAGAVALGGKRGGGPTSDLRLAAFGAVVEREPTPWYYNPDRLGPRRRLQVDICVYGATAGGVMAATQASMSGRRTVLLAFGDNVGGMTTSGISATDIGDSATIGGLARSFYQRVAAAYGHVGVIYDFEPHVAETVIIELLQRSGVTVLRRQPLAEVKTGVTASAAPAITEITTEAGTAVRAAQYIDASYEGDLLARAGVNHRVGREANSTYGETLNGVQPARSGAGFVARVDPYRTAGKPSSGFLTGVETPTHGTPGRADGSSMAYGFRLCITEAPGALPFPKPPRYRSAEWELALRSIQGGEWDLLDFRVGLPGGKYDLNARGGISTDAVGLGQGWADADYPTREQLFQRHVHYDQGLLWFAGHDRRVPASIRADVARFGLAGDEFAATGGWPPELYVREARRLVSDYVMTEADCLGRRQAPDPVALGSYKVDGHACVRSVVDRLATDEGILDEGVSRPYGISLRSLFPARGECANLTVSTCVASSHVAWSSLRMEPVFMMLGQAAAMVSSLAIDGGVAVQDVPYASVAAALTSAGAELGSPATPTAG